MLRGAALLLRSGRKEELLERVAEAKALGVPPELRIGFAVLCRALLCSLFSLSI